MDEAAPSYRILQTPIKSARFGWSLAFDKSSDRMVIVEVCERDAYEALNARDPLKRLMGMRGLVAQVLDRRADDKRAFVVSAVPEGQSLAAAMPELTPEARRIQARALIQALDEANALGVVIGFLHPSLLYGTDSGVVLAQPGLSAFCTAGGVSGSEVAGLMGERAAPELTSGAPSFAADVFALGVLLQELKPDWPEELQALVAGLTGLDPDQRVMAFRALSRRLLSSSWRRAATAVVSIAALLLFSVSTAVLVGNYVVPDVVPELSDAAVQLDSRPPVDARWLAGGELSTCEDPQDEFYENQPVPVSDGTSVPVELQEDVTAPDYLFQRAERLGGLAEGVVTATPETKEAQVGDLLRVAEDNTPKRNDGDDRDLSAPERGRERTSAVSGGVPAMDVAELLAPKEEEPPSQPAKPVPQEPEGPPEWPGDFEKHLCPLPLTRPADLTSQPAVELSPAERQQLNFLLVQLAGPVAVRSGGNRRTQEESTRASQVLALKEFRHPDVTRAASSLARHASPVVRKAAAQTLVAQNTPEAIRALLPMLADQDAQVSIAAREALTALRDAEAVRFLFETALQQTSAPQVRLEVARILGLIGDVRAVPMLRRSLKDGDGGVRGASAEALGRMRALDARDELAALLDDSDPRAKVGALLALGAFRDAAVRAKAESLLLDPAPLVRRMAYKTLLAIRDPASIPVLIEQMGREPGALKDDCLRALILLTGQNLGAATKSWATWWAQRKDGFRLPPLARALKVLNEMQGEVAYYGIQTFSKRIIFLIDISGSMGGTPLAQAKERLVEAINAFTPEHRFNIIAFESDLHPWQRNIVPFSVLSRRSASDFVAHLDSTGGTNIYDSLKTALEDRNADTIFLLSDGSPSSGEVVDTAGILAAVRKLNADYHATIHCIALGGAVREFMQHLADENGGRCVFVE